jgi:hypothetical protein
VALLAVMVLDPDYELTAKHSNNICRFSSLWWRPDKVMAACDRAITLGESDPDYTHYHNSQGIARALAGDYDGALEDFRFLSR